jgi:NAD(P)-dependent dehydrogenase (short-subunit alcohol dehydrogenase family)
MAASKGIWLSPSISLERVGQPEEIAEAIIWLLGSESGYVTGSVYRVDGGMLDY